MMNELSAISRPRAGRPTREQAEARHEELLDRAPDHFLDKGFENFAWHGQNQDLGK